MPNREPDPEVIDSWKEISGYLHRDIRTLQRWERTRGLPVRRMPGGPKPGVYAVRAELDAWRRSRGIHPVTTHEAGTANGMSIAVLPFLNLAGQQDDQYFADGLADEIITELSRMPGLRVTARTSSFALRGTDQDVREVGRRLNARAVLEGSLRRAGNRIRVTAQLVETSEGYHLWSECYDRELTDVFSIQDDITSRIVEALRLRLTPAPAPARRATPKPESYRLWLKGRYHTLRQTPSEIGRSRELFEEAIALDPGFARAHLGLAESLWEGAVVGLVRPREAVAAGRESVRRTLEIDPTLGEAHAMLGLYHGIHEFDWEAAERSFLRAIEASPLSPEVRSRYAFFFLSPKLRLDEAAEELERALEYDPLSPFVHGCLGHCLILRRDFQQAAEQLELAVELDPTYSFGQLFLAGSYAFQGKFDKAIGICMKLMETVGPNAFVTASTALLLAVAGDRSAAQEMLRQLMEASRTSYVSPLALSFVHLGLGEIETCLDCLVQAVEERHPMIVELPSKALYDGLRPHPRFQALLRRMGLKGYGE